MIKTKENGCFDYGKIELIEPSDAIMADSSDSAELELGEQVFCASWPAILKYLQKKKALVKNPLLRFLFGAGLSVADGFHDDMCKSA
jgi:hypothetical protein